MQLARMLASAAMIGLSALALTFGSTLLHPAPTAAAATLPASHVGAPDIGYPSCPSGCQIQDGGRAPSFGDGYPCAIRSCAEHATTAPPASGDVGYPGCPSSCRAQDGVSVPSSGDEGHPVCTSGCRVQEQPVDDEGDSAVLV